MRALRGFKRVTLKPGESTRVSIPLTDETFDGVIWEMRPPKSFLDLVSEISDWQTKFGAATQGPYQSESFNGYSYSKGTATDASGKSVPVTWQTTFAPYLNQWRKLA